jgi:hypothetical protein
VQEDAAGDGSQRAYEDGNSPSADEGLLVQQQPPQQEQAEQQQLQQQQSAPASSTPATSSQRHMGSSNSGSLRVSSATEDAATGMQGSLLGVSGRKQPLPLHGDYHKERWSNAKHAVHSTPEAVEGALCAVNKLKTRFE